MGKYLVTSGSHFRPLSYDEMVKPLAQMTEAHNAAQDVYDQLSMETEALRQYISENEDDKRAKQMYDSYVDKLSTLQNNLWSNGFNAGTRRDLASARASYASDVTALKNAITNRQERSKEYWDARHKDPTLVTGFDPGTGGLDNYLGNPDYGRDWYSYSGTQFANEVAADAKARGAEMINSYATTNPNLAGYLEYHVRNGFTNQQVDNAGMLARQILSGQVDPNDPNIDPVESLLATTLISRLSSSGARPGQNLSAEEFERMFNYGMLGLAQGIGKEDMQLVNNKVWDHAMSRADALYKARLNASANAGDGVHREAILSKQQSGNSDKVIGNISKVYDKDTYANGNTVNIRMPDGSIKQLHSSDEALDLFMTNRVQNFLSATGIDVRQPASNILHTEKSKKTGSDKGTPLKVERDGLGLNGHGKVKRLVSGKWVDDPLLTNHYNEAVDEYRSTMHQIESLNPGMKLTNYGLSPSESHHLRKKYDIPDSVPDYDLEAAILSKQKNGFTTSATIAQGPEDDDIKVRLATIMDGMYGYDGQNYSKTSLNGFYKVGKDGITESKINAAAGKNGLADIFKMTNGRIDPNSIVNIGINPEDIKDGRVRVRVTASNGKNVGTYVTDITTLGNDLAGSTQALSGIVRELMLPATNTIDVLDTNKGLPVGQYMLGYGNWENEMNALLADYADYLPWVRDGNTIRLATGKEIARNPNYRDQYLNAVTAFIQDAINYGLEPNTLRPRQHKGYTSSKSSSLVDDE